MDEDVLSDVIPSNIVSRQASNVSPLRWPYIHRVDVGLDSKVRAQTMARASTSTAARAWKRTSFRATKKIRSACPLSTNCWINVVLCRSLSRAVHHRRNWQKYSSLPRGRRKSKNEWQMKVSFMQSGRRWTRQRYLLHHHFVYCILIVVRLPTLSSAIHICWVRRTSSSTSSISK